jgi:hypothetical protein
LDRLIRELVDFRGEVGQLSEELLPRESFELERPNLPLPLVIEALTDLMCDLMSLLRRYS